MFNGIVKGGNMNCGDSSMIEQDLFQCQDGGSIPTSPLQVVVIDKKIASRFILEKHYSHRMPIFWYGFGLVENRRIVGVIVYGQPSAPIQIYAFKNRDFKMIELSRLVIQTKTRNAASFLISHSLKMLPTPCSVISYADSEYNHCGYVYQATNWIYTGATISHDHLYLYNGERLHPMTVRDRFGVTKIKEWAKENNIESVKPSPKHRYFFFVGSKNDKKKMASLLSYKIISEYPKIEPKRYDDGAEIKQGYGIILL